MYEAQGNKKADLARVVSERHCLRLEALIQSVGKNNKGEKVKCMCIISIDMSVLCGLRVGRHWQTPP